MILVSVVVCTGVAVFFWWYFSDLREPVKMSMREGPNQVKVVKMDAKGATKISKDGLEV